MFSRLRTAPRVTFAGASTRIVALAVIGVCALLAGTSQGAQAQAGVDSTTTRSHAVAIWRDMHGNVLCKQRYGEETMHQTVDPATSHCSKELSALSGHGTGGTPSNGGSITVHIGEIGRSTFGYHLWKIAINTYWYWSDQGTHALGVPGFGTTKADHRAYQKAHRDWDVTSSGVKWDGWTGGSAHYYDWETGRRQTGFHHSASGSFEVPNALSPPVNYEYPEVILDSHTNGTWEWWTSCRGC